MPIYDISRRISPQTATWPGVDAMRHEHMMRLDAGNAVNLTFVTMTPHTATHADAGYHFAADGLHPDELPLEKFIGPAHVVSLTRRSGAIPAEEVRQALNKLGNTGQVERLLIHSHISSNPDDAFTEEYPYPSVELIEWLADQGAVLLGLDSPSMDAFDSKDLPGHNRLRDRDMVHLELLQLSDVPDGVYELIALPLKLGEVCGSPVRAILRG